MVLLEGRHASCQFSDILQPPPLPRLVERAFSSHCRAGVVVALEKLEASFKGLAGRNKEAEGNAVRACTPQLGKHLASPG